MSLRIQKLDAVDTLANQLIAAGRKMHFPDLVVWLNSRGFRTNQGSAYRNSRGAARLVSAAYAYVRNELGRGDAGAAPIALAFINQHGEYSYE